jgi:hypothetical protein
MKKATAQPRPITYESLMESIHESNRYLTEKFAETDRKMAETDRLIKETSQQMKETDRKMAETDRKMAETDRLIQESKKLIDTNWEQIRANSKDIGGIGKSNGEVAEEYFTNSFMKDLRFAGQEFDSLAVNLRKKIKKINLQGEFDLALYNGSSVAIIEVKYKAEKRDIEDLLTKPQIFKQLFPEYVDFNIYLGLAGLSMKQEVEKEAVKNGVAVIKQVGDNMVIYDNQLKIF